jgi:hypothetical protein
MFGEEDIEDDLRILHFWPSTMSQQQRYYLVGRGIYFWEFFFLFY